MTGLIPPDLQVRSPGALGPDAYFVAAYELLGERGYDSVTIGGLCERLGVTKGSFYHHFADMPAFVAAFADQARQWNADRFTSFEAEPDPLRRWERMANELPDWGGPAEVQLRAWARAHPVLAAVVIDSAYSVGTPVAVRTCAEIVDDDELGRALCYVAMSMVAGIQLQLDPLDLHQLRRLLQEFSRRCLGVDVEILDRGAALKVSDTPSVRRGSHRETQLPATEGLTWAAYEQRPCAVPSISTSLRRDDYFAAARQLLSRSGPDAVTVAELCRSLSISTGSFHHHFEGLPQFVEALTEDWEAVHECRLAAVRAVSNPMRRLQVLLQRLLTEPDPTDTAWRARAHTEPVIGYALRRMDRRRQALLTETIGEATQDSEADILATATLALTIGLQESQRPVVGPDLAALIVVEWANSFLRIDTTFEVVDGAPVLALSGAGIPD
jgi:AcrR family transcriptional regulator